MSERSRTPSADVEGSQSTGRINNIIRRFSRKATPPRLLSLRSRRGLPQSGSLELDLVPNDNVGSSANIDIQAASSIDNNLAPIPASVERHRGSIREDSLRKREKIAELRKKRLNPAGEAEIDIATPSRAGAQLAALFRTPPKGLNDSSHSAALSPTRLSSGTSAMPTPMRQGYGQWLSYITPVEDGFFNSPELNLLLQQIDLDLPAEAPAAAVASPSMVTPATSVDISITETLVQSPSSLSLHAPSMRRANSHNGQGLGINTASNGYYGETDFTINIPSTSLSPVVPLGSRNLLRPSLARRRSRTVMPLATANSDNSGRATANRMQHQRQQQFSSRSKHATTAYDDADLSSDEDIEEIMRQLEKEKAINERLRRDLAQANDTANAMINLLNATASLQRLNDGINGSSSKHSNLF
ncbi:hypothetical protein IW150_005072 [Coemansia sp. RSA 2607]|nr:hypothetical protein IW150_005072 [Coemansia sp. RSA 2607]